MVLFRRITVLLVFFFIGMQRNNFINIFSFALGHNFRLLSIHHR